MKNLVLQHTAVAVDRPEDFAWYERVERSLGPRSRRYLGGGYKRVRHEVTSVAPGPAPDSLGATATVVYPEDWSQKSQGARADTHLSTVDNLLLSARLMELLLRRGLRLSEEDLRQSRVVAVAMSLGGSPTTHLSGLPCQARHLGTRRHPAARGVEISTAEIRLAKVRTVLQVEHPASTAGGLRLAIEPAHAPGILAEVNDCAGKLYGDGYIGRDVELTDVLVDKRCNSLTCIMRLRFLASADRPGEAPFPSRGLGAAHAEAVDVLDLMVSGAQLSQILIYGARGLDRNQTSNLWMREFKARCAEPLTGMGALLPLAVAVESQVVDVNGTRYAVDDVTLQIPGAADVQITGSFALQL